MIVVMKPGAEAEQIDVAVERWQRFTGKAAVLEGDGRYFGDLKRNGHSEDTSALVVETPAN